MSEVPYGFDCQRLRAARESRRLSVAEIAAAAGLSDRAVSFYLAGTRHPRAEILPRLARAVGLDDPLDLCDIGDGERIVHLRVRAGKSRAQLSGELGWHPETYREWETTGEAEGKMRGPRDRWEPDPQRPGWGWMVNTPFFTRPVIEPGRMTGDGWHPARLGPCEYGNPEHQALFGVPAERLSQALDRTRAFWRVEWAQRTARWERDNPELAADIKQAAAALRRP
ncbi:helix-turn-helix transcriptional regulator [Streptomyces yaizuensis]|uniref:HTH cro/C1-type domain-containing protein n=1 Tax=Streptomyces yaizuensis TaxID=2989713 RepID=A0AA86IVC4_9ACTN|nr:helix-turn-helix transcriptional regulator [Streptomyces sp. YSPA8]BDT39481.1 hypothetical protein SYYSPA8_36815 [Streptomyces sp. YSPA8]